MNWAAILRTGLAIGLMPETLWRLSLVEWRALTGPLAATVPLDRAGLEALRQRFPDNSDKEAER
ncbi:phage tail assembly chaperone [Maricaulis sp.]|uniref:phage tail assembly chaperone n=1 Tax=Maricaulis sp. TaxID=1486257 RepID=UPI0025BFB0A8|nr:phage tail assembly chaperone [Maricaulis sp.]